MNELDDTSINMKAASEEAGQILHDLSISNGNNQTPNGYDDQNTPVIGGNEINKIPSEVIPEENPVIPEEDNEGTGTVLPPNTGVQVNFFLEGALLISILVAATALKKLCK